MTTTLLFLTAGEEYGVLPRDTGHSDKTQPDPCIASYDLPVDHGQAWDERVAIRDIKDLKLR